tara:strand:+ start:201 stop:578 length:378 start_codon:yes stop_codon:yes gene_type:complete
MLRESLDEILEEFNPTHFTTHSITVEVTNRYLEKINRKLSGDLSSIISRMLATRGWIKSSFRETKTDDILRRGEISDYFWSRVPSKIENQWFNTVKEAGAISTATPGFIPRPRYRKKRDDDKDNE